MESNDSPEIPDRGETSDIPGLPSGVSRRSKEGIDNVTELTAIGHHMPDYEFLGLFFSFHL